MVRLDDFRPGVWDETVDVIQNELKDYGEFDTNDVIYEWRKAANYKRQERELFEQYGYLKDLILHPLFQSWKQYVEEMVNTYVHLDVTLGDPLMPLATIIVLLFLMQKRIPNDALALVGGFLFNVNPIYVVVAFTFVNISLHYSTSNVPKQFIATKKPLLDSILDNKGNSCPIDAALDIRDSVVCPPSTTTAPGTPTTPGHDESIRATWTTRNGVETPSASPRNTPVKGGSDSTSVDNSSEMGTDHILIGTDISTLYAAAMLCKNGHKVIVLQPENGEKLSCKPNGAPCAVPLQNAIIPTPERYQALLDVLQCSNSTDKGVRFVPVGSEATGYTHSIIKYKQLATAGNGAASNTSRLSDLWGFRPFISPFAYELCTKLMVESTSITNLLERLYRSQQAITAFLYNRSFPVEQQEATESKSELEKEFDQVAMSSCADVLHSIGISPDYDTSKNNKKGNAFDLLMSFVNHTVDELALQPTRASTSTLAQAVSALDTGFFYPEGGVGAIEAKLISIIQAHGSHVVKNVNIKEIKIKPVEESTASEGSKAYIIDHVLLEDSTQLYANRSVFSGMGYIGTYLSLFDRKHPAIQAILKNDLDDLVEAKPVAKVIVYIENNNAGTYTNVTEEDMGLSSADYVELPMESMLMQDQSIGNSSIKNGALRIWCPSMKDPTWKQRWVIYIYIYYSSFLHLVPSSDN